MARAGRAGGRALPRVRDGSVNQAVPCLVDRKDESGDYTALTGGIAQWYDNQLFVCSLGQGISSKAFE